MSEVKPHYILVPSGIGCAGCALWKATPDGQDYECAVGDKSTACIQHSPTRYYILKEKEHRPANNGGTV
jgi:hypothetical protein